MERLNAVLPAVWSHNNPIDIIGDAPPDRYAKALEIAAADPDTDGLLVILTPQAMTDPTRDRARRWSSYAQIEGKPVLASWMGGTDVAEGAAILREAGIPTFAYPDTRLRPVQPPVALRRQPARRCTRRRRLPIAPERGEFREEVDRIIADVARRGPHAPDRVREQEGARRLRHPDHRHRARPDRGRGGRRRATRWATRSWPSCSAGRSPTRPTSAASAQPRGRPRPCATRSSGSATSVAEKAGAEHFEGVTVQPMVNWSRLRADRRQQPGSAVRPGAAVRHGRPARRGVPRPRAGPAAAQHDARPAPDRARRRSRRRSRGVRGRRPSTSRRSQRCSSASASSSPSSRGSREIDINPLLASPERIIALDARVVLPPGRDRRRGPAPPRHPPVPARVRRREVADATATPIVDPADPARGRAAAGPRSTGRCRRRRSAPATCDRLALAERTAHERLIRICFVDYDREIALVAEAPVRRRLGRGRRSSACRGSTPSERRTSSRSSSPTPGSGAGSGASCSGPLIAVARGEGARGIFARLSPENHAMRALLTEAGFTFAERGELLVASLATS